MTGEHSGTAGGEFYDAVYGAFEGQLAAMVRAEALGEDIGQNSWLTAEEYRVFFDWLELGSSSEVLDVGSGSGGPALFMVSETGCSVTGLELHGAGVAAANRAAGKRHLAARARFVQGDGREPLPFPTASFDALLCIDSINHMFERLSVFGEWHRVLRPGGRALFTDPLTVTGLLRREEILLRSGSLGEQVFTAHGVDERLLRAAGFDEVRIEDVTPNMAAVAAGRRRARARHAAELAAVEGEQGNAAYDRYLAVVELLARERRLSRWAYLAARST
ncbi:MAG TPA: class I SAM-dependent methyltransferase [Solirubrobacteraceae bacterium]|nr:class I SAM-dependent methyltransferase [Solirubrobacteraceae bacterium]